MLCLCGSLFTYIVSIMKENFILSRGEELSFSFKSDSYFFKYNKKLINLGDWSRDIYLPVSIFSSSPLSALEVIVKYLKEEVGLSYREIGILINRNERTVWSVYRNSKKKMSKRFFVSYSRFYIPIAILRDRSLGVLEAITEYMKDELQLRYCRIASLLNRDDRTIWTVYKRAKKKRKNGRSRLQYL